MHDTPPKVCNLRLEVCEGRQNIAEVDGFRCIEDHSWRLANRTLKKTSTKALQGNSPEEGLAARSRGRHDSGVCGGAICGHASAVSTRIRTWLVCGAECPKLEIDRSNGSCTIQVTEELARRLAYRRIASRRTSLR